jgi:hypothetical protein
MHIECLIGQPCVLPSKCFEQYWLLDWSKQDQIYKQFAFVVYFVKLIKNSNET